MTSKEFLLDQFISGYDVNGWFVALKNAIANLTVEDAAWKPENMDNSIWGILTHLNFYNKKHLKKFKGEVIEKSNLENHETFANTENNKEKGWQFEVERFDSIMNDWRDALESAEEDKFAQKVSAENQTAWAEVIGLINTHNAYHGGQIVVLRKLQGNWDSSKGVS